MPLAKIQDVAGYFPGFRQWEPPPYVTVKVCRDMSCHLRGAAELRFDPVRGLKGLERGGELPVVVEGVSCLGRCDRAPVCLVSRTPTRPSGHQSDLGRPKFALDPENALHEQAYCGRDAAEMRRIVAQIAAGGQAEEPDHDGHFEVDSSDWQIDVYARRPVEFPQKYEAVRRFVEKHPAPVSVPRGLNADALKEHVKQHHTFLAQIEAAALIGMGGAGGAAFQKWFDVWSAGGAVKYVVCNGDESEPGTFKDRELLLRMPHLVVEGVILAGLVVGATAGFVFIRHEYEEQIEAVKAEIERAKELGACGTNVFGSGQAFQVEVYVSPGGYILGEQTALIEAMEDKRGQPRNRPPELQENGLFDKPTVLNNVETLAWTPAICLLGGKWYASAGAPGCKGRRLFSISGDVEKPAPFEVPAGTTIGQLIDLAGGVSGGRALKAVATSGPSGGFWPAKIPVPARAREAFPKALLRDLLPRRLGLKDDAAEKTRLAALEADATKALLPSTPPIRLDEWIAAVKDIVRSSLADAWDDSAAESLDKVVNDVRLHDLPKSIANVLAAWPADKTHLDLGDLPMDVPFFRNAGRLFGMKPDPMLGAALVVYAEGRDILTAARNCTQFFRNESCGKCVPCRIGSEKLVGIGTAWLERRDGVAPDGDRPAPPPSPPAELVTDLADVMNLTSICGLGQVAYRPMTTFLQFFAGELTAAPGEG